MCEGKGRGLGQSMIWPGMTTVVYRVQRWEFAVVIEGLLMINSIERWQQAKLNLPTGI